MSIEGKGRSSMGNHKHYISGHPNKSPRQRMHDILEARKNDRRAKKFKMFSSIKGLFNK